MTTDEYEKLPPQEREHFFQCSKCGELGHKREASGKSLEHPAAISLMSRQGRVFKLAIGIKPNFALNAVAEVLALLSRRWAERQTSLFLRPNTQDRYGSTGYGRAYPRAPRTRHTPCAVFHFLVCWNGNGRERCPDHSVGRPLASTLANATIVCFGIAFAGARSSTAKPLKSFAGMR
jgi:hypothetical protein